MPWIGFGALGFLIGNITGLSASPIASILIPTLFTLFGGSLLGYFSKLDAELRTVSSACLTSFSTLCLIGLYVGIIVNARQLIGPPPFRTSAAAAVTKVTADPGAQRPASANEAPKDLTAAYLRSDILSEASAIDQRVNTGQLTKEEAYEELSKVVRK